MTESFRESPRELATQKIQLRKQQEKLLSDLLSVVDALDHAAEHWQQAEKRQIQQAEAKRAADTSDSLTRWQRWQKWFRAAPVFSLSQLQSESDDSRIAPAANSENMAEMVTSAREGIDMIRESMLSVLSQHQIVPLPAVGAPFDPDQMHALGQQADAEAMPNTVVQEVVRGYRWQQRTLRPAQVIVAIAPPKTA
jgi:molecular chaperone GrpE (heat shock protein)